MEKFLGESHIVEFQAGLDLDTAFAGERKNMKNVERLTFAVAVNAGAAAVLKFNLLQHTLAVAGTSKALPVVNKYFYTLENQATVQVDVDVLNPLAEIDLSAVAANKKVVVLIEVLAENLDVDNDFQYVSLNAADAGVASPATITYLGEAKYKPAYTQNLK